MANMTAIPATIDGVAYSFRLLEADIPALTFDHVPENPPTLTGADFDAHMSLRAAIGINDFGRGREVGPMFVPGIFRDLVMPKGISDFGYVMPTGKTLLAYAAKLLTDSRSPHPIEVVATLAMALKGGGLGMQSAADAAWKIQRSNSQSAANRHTYAQTVLVPQILNAAAAA